MQEVPYCPVRGDIQRAASTCDATPGCDGFSYKSWLGYLETATSPTTRATDVDTYVKV